MDHGVSGYMCKSENILYILLGMPQTPDWRSSAGGEETPCQLHLCVNITIQVENNVYISINKLHSEYEYCQIYK